MKKILYTLTLTMALMSPISYADGMDDYDEGLAPELETSHHEEYIAPDVYVTDPADDMVLELSPSPINDYAIQDRDADPWEVDSKMTLRELLQEWSDRAGYTLIWEAHADYSIGVDITVHGTFREAVKKVMQHYWYRKVPLQSIVYRNRVLRVREWQS